jgi:bifunctional UDP-N-acetylglucosamine pyrophosphorylase/glucosamine-1-phosphate N-acetyltransferase
MVELQIMGVVLAGGKGKRMKSSLYKVLHRVCGKPLVGHVVDVLEQIKLTRTVVIVGHGADTVKAYLGDRVEYAVQEQQLGTGHAVQQAEALIGQEDGLTFVVCGDAPLVTERSLRKMIELQQQTGAAGTMLTARMDHPAGYGRIVRAEDGRVLRIVEHKDCTPSELEIKEINAGTYLFNNRMLFQALKEVTNDNAQNEYYFTDAVDILVRQGKLIEGYCTDDAAEAVGVNDRVALSQAEKLMRERINTAHMLGGVTLIDPSNTYIDASVQIGMDTTVYPGTKLSGSTIIGEGCVVGPNSEIVDSQIDDNVTVMQSVLNHATVGSDTTVGPFAYLRPGSRIGKGVKIGDFVEIKNASIDDGTKISHLSYVGDANVGKNVNIGCGAITVNYDGYNKHVTEIEDDAFVGSNVNLIAPVRIGKAAYVVAGSTITDDVNGNDLAIARERQTNKAGYADKLRNRIQSKDKV